MKVFIGADHNGFHLRNSLIDYMAKAGYEVQDDGDKVLNIEDDFPIYANKVVADVLQYGSKARGILICGSGQGMCMAANRFKGIRAVLGYDRESIRSARNDDDANVLCLPASAVKDNSINVLVEVFMNTPFAAAPRFARRISELDNLTA